MQDKSTFETLGDRLKQYEADYETSISPDYYIIVRIDGHKFSKFTKGFKRPFDAFLSTVMEATTMALVDEFQAVVGYTQSDEITLVIPKYIPLKEHYNKKPKQDITHLYNGRVQKIASLTAGFATMAFNKMYDDLLFNYEWKDRDPETGMSGEYEMLVRSKNGRAWFDSRVYAVPTDVEAFNSVLWRIRDAEKNSYSMFAQAFCKHKDLQKMTGKEQVKFCKETTGEDYDLVADRYKYGILVKKEQYIKAQGWDDFEVNPRFQKNDAVVRTRLTAWSEKLNYSEENVDMVTRKIK